VGNPTSPPSPNLGEGVFVNYNYLPAIKSKLYNHLFTSLLKIMKSFYHTLISPVNQKYQFPGEAGNN